VTRVLVRSGFRVRVFARRSSRLDILSNLDVDLALGDITSSQSLHAALDGVEAVVHCSGLVSLRLADRDAMERINVAGTRNVLEAAAAKGVRVLHTSTIATLGPTIDECVLDERSAEIPLTFDYPYADSKRKSEKLAFDFHARGLNVVVLNPGILFGPGDVHFTSTQFVLRYLRREVWSYLAGGASFGDVRDVAAAYVGALERGRAGERYVLAGMNRSYRALQDELCRLTGLQRSAPMPRPVAEWFALWSQAGSAFGRHAFDEFNLSVVRWASMFNFCSSEKAGRELGYRTRDFSQTLADTIADHLRRGAATASTFELKRLLGERLQVPDEYPARSAQSSR
jgi:dihydroflavonol-4-reductase